MAHIVHGLGVAHLFSSFPRHENGNITRLEVLEALPVAKNADSTSRPKCEMRKSRWKLVEERRRTFRSVISPVSVRVFWTEPYETSRCWLFVDGIGKANQIAKMRLWCCICWGALILNWFGRSNVGRSIIRRIFVECPDTCCRRRSRSSRYWGSGHCARFRVVAEWLLQSWKILTEPRGQSTERFNIGGLASRIPELRLIESLRPCWGDRGGRVLIRFCHANC